MNKHISLKVNGQEIPMNPFVKDIFANVLNGLVDALDKIPEKPKKIELLVESE